MSKVKQLTFDPRLLFKKLPEISHITYFSGSCAHDSDDKRDWIALTFDPRFLELRAVGYSEQNYKEIRA